MKKYEGKTLMKLNVSNKIVEAILMAKVKKWQQMKQRHCLATVTNWAI